ncbi:MAG TPA: Fe-S cluster assembly protein SufD [Methylocystis sp.]|nr:Fe-S cluster assembly protein SufD [Methylocystis sp.]
MRLARERSSADLALEQFFERRKHDRAADLREEAWDSFTRKGLPSRRVESWHYTDLRAVLREISPEAAEAGKPAHVTPPAGVVMTSLREALAQGDVEVMAALAPQTGDAAVDLNAALMQDGAVVRIGAGVRLDHPLTLDASAAEGASSFTRNLVLVGESARATIVETAPPLLARGQENHALVLQLAAGAEVELVSDFGPGDPETVRIYSLLASIAQGSALKSSAFIWGGGLLRRQIFATLAGERAAASFNGVAMLGQRAHADVTLVVRHAAPHGKSRERFRYIVDDEATGVFQGKVSVAQAAQKTDGAMQSKALLLSPGATMNSKPELEIFADDVVCGHGAACGRLEAEQMFYLMARGLPRAEAEALLIEGFANEALAEIETETLREAFGGKVASWLGARRLQSKGDAR